MFLLSFFVACADKENEWDATGSFEATEVLVSSQANGLIMALDFQEGDRLQTGQLLGTIDSVQLFLKKQQLLVSMKAMDIRKPDIQKQIASIRRQMQTAQTELTRAQNLLKAKAGNQKMVDDYTNQLALLQKQLEAQQSTLAKTYSSADAEVESMQYQVMQMDDLLSKCRICNPRAGIVLTKYAEAGETAAVGMPLYKIADTELMYLRAYITADQVAAIKLGQEVSVFSDQGEQYDGTIAWISSKSEFTPKGIMTKDERANLVYAVKIAVRNDGTLKIGQYGEVDF